MRVPALLLVLAATAAGLSACQTPEERRAADEQRCLSYGFKRGTDGFATCLQRIDLDRRAESRANQAQMMWDLNYGFYRPVYVYRGHRHHR